MRSAKKNFRADPDMWRAAMTKAESMRRDGYDVDMTFLLNQAVAVFVAETAEESAERLDLSRADEPVPVYRHPDPRPPLVGRP